MLLSRIWNTPAAAAVAGFAIALIAAGDVVAFLTMAGVIGPPG